ncbi:MAG TPA: hypothetical protein VIH02_06710 [Flavobacterium sp.]
MRLLGILTLLLLFTFSALSQNKKFTYTQFDITVSIKGNPDRNLEDPYTHEKGTWFLPDGLVSRFGLEYITRNGLDQD